MDKEQLDISARFDKEELDLLDQAAFAPKRQDRSRARMIMASKYRYTREGMRDWRFDRLNQMKEQGYV